MIKILFIGHVRESSGWGIATRDWIKALISLGPVIDLTVRSIDLDPKASLHESIADCMKKPLSDNYDVVIQNVIPGFMEYNKYAGKNIGLCFIDTENIEMTPWAQRLSLMDEVWVTNDTARMEVKKFNKNTHIILPAVDQSKYEYVSDNTHVDAWKDTTKFYFIGELNPRKNIPALIKAFYLTFDRNDLVSLILKVSQGDPAEAYQRIKGDIEKIAGDLKLYRTFEQYPDIHIITDYLSDEDMLSLHKTCDCLVIPSYQEGFCLPALDALHMGNHVIGNNIGGLEDMAKYGLERVMNGRMVPVEKMRNLFTDVFTARERWASIDIDQLCKHMYSFHMSPNRPKKKVDMSVFSYEKVATSMVERILTA